MELSKNDAKLLVKYIFRLEDIANNEGYFLDKIGYTEELANVIAKIGETAELRGDDVV